MNMIFLGIVTFLCVLAVFDLVVGVSNDAVNFLNSAIGAKVAKFRTIVLVAAIGVFAGASMSNGMMDVARHGILTPVYYSFYEVICIFLAVMVTDVILLDIFNTLGMPTSTTVSMVFELLGGAFAIAVLKIAHGAVSPDGTILRLGVLLNTEKAISVIMGIFLSVAIAFVSGLVVMWLSRLVFTFSYSVKGAGSPLRIGIFAGIALTSIVWFLLINGLKGSSFMSADLKETINAHTWLILGGCTAVFSILMTVLGAFRLPVLKYVVLAGTFALAMAFAGNDLVNFVGVPLTGLAAYKDYTLNGNGDPDGFLMDSLMGSAHTPVIFLVIAGIIMVASLIFSKKAQNVVKTSVDLSRQDQGDEMFGASPVARAIVRNSNRSAGLVIKILPERFRRWINSRFNSDEMVLPSGAAFDEIRAAVNLVVAGLLVAAGTSMKLPLSTTYVTFMVAMGSSLADKAWSRESAVFRITGVISVIGGWFITAGAAFIFCFLLTNIMYFGSYVAMVLAIVLAIFILARSNFRKDKKEEETGDKLSKQILRCDDKNMIWDMLCEHIRTGNAARLRFVTETYISNTDAFMYEQYQPLKRSTSQIDEERKALKRQRRQEILAMQRLDPTVVIGNNTWYFLGISSCQQMLYCLKRINEPLREHIGNNFLPLPSEHHQKFIAMRDDVIGLYKRALSMLETGDFSDAEQLRIDGDAIQSRIAQDRKYALDMIQEGSTNLNTLFMTIHIMQESQELIDTLRHMIRGMKFFQQSGNDLKYCYI